MPSNRLKDADSGMIGIPPSARGGRPADIAEHASEVAREWADVAEDWVRKRQEKLGIPDGMIGELTRGGRRAFNPLGTQGGANCTGIEVDSGVLHPELLQGKKGGRIWAKLPARARADAIIAHEYGELRYGSYVDALKAAAKTKLPITPESRRLCKAMAR